jgi:hypothetical protein
VTVCWSYLRGNCSDVAGESERAGGWNCGWKSTSHCGRHCPIYSLITDDEQRKAPGHAQIHDLCPRMQLRWAIKRAVAFPTTVPVMFPKTVHSRAGSGNFFGRCHVTFRPTYKYQKVSSNRPWPRCGFRKLTRLIADATNRLRPSVDSILAAAASVEGTPAALRVPSLSHARWLVPQLHGVPGPQHCQQFIDRAAATRDSLSSE